MRSIYPLFALLVASAPGALAQTPTGRPSAHVNPPVTTATDASAPTPGAAPTVAVPVVELTKTSAAVAPAAGATGGDPDMQRLFENVSSIADQLKSDLSNLETNIQASHDSMDKGGDVLNAMLASVTELHSKLAEDGAIWTDLNTLMERWGQRRQAAVAKSEANPTFAKIAEEWSERIKTARLMRSQISTERANSLGLIRAIETDREVVLAYYELGQADKAIESLQKVSQNLQALNTNMQSIVQTAGAVQRPIAN